MQNQLRRLPQIQTLLEHREARRLIGEYGHSDVAGAARLKLGDIRRAIMQGGNKTPEPDWDTAFFSDIEHSLRGLRAASLTPVINATGIIISTNLGRARLAPEAIEAMQVAAANYTALEMDLETGKRGSRQTHVEALICQLTGAEAALVVNNCAAAVLTTLAALAGGKEVIASRGELVEIGGSFRMPDVIAQSGARLKEVGATNKTRLSDYETAISDDTALLLKSHTSNYRLVGFTAAPERGALIEMARAAGLPFVEDLGSGLLAPLTACNLPDEPVVRDVIAAGADIVMFSGDKLLGGPQAGIIAGKADLIARIAASPVARACRIDKLSLAALQATLQLYLAPNDPFDRVPVLKMLSEPPDCVHARAEAALTGASLSGHLSAEIVPSAALAGGGTLPEQDLPSFALALKSDAMSAHHFTRDLRRGPVPVLGRVTDETLLLDMRAVREDEVSVIADALTRLSAP